jgi:hypothetical protein
MSQTIEVAEVAIRRSQRIQQRNNAKAEFAAAAASSSDNNHLAATTSKKEKLTRTKSIKRKNDTNVEQLVAAKSIKTPPPPLDLDECTCSICIDVLVEPVSLPCKHEFCLNCIFNATNAELYFSNCPLCRKLVPNSLLREKNRSKLVNANRWAQIQKAFDAEIRNKQNAKMTLSLFNDLGKNEQQSSGSNEARRMVVVTDISEPGAINREYMENLRQLAEERENEERASLALIQRLLNQEDEGALLANIQLI